MTEAALPLIEALAALREEAVRNGHEMDPAGWFGGTLASACTRCRCGCAVRERDGAVTVRFNHADKPCKSRVVD